MRDGIQELFSAIGSDGCMALCLVDIASKFLHKSIDPFDAIAHAIHDNIIFYDFRNPNNPDRMYVNRTDLFLEKMTGYVWQEKRVEELPKNRHEFYIIEQWKSRHTGKELTHFSRPNFKPLEFSQTMKYGKIKEYRLWKPIKIAEQVKTA